MTEQESEDPDSLGQSLTARIRALFGPGVDPGIVLEPQGEDGTPSDVSAAVLSRLTTRPYASGRYRIQGEVARGGQGAILRVWDEELRRHLAMKVTLGKLPAPDGTPGPRPAEAGAEPEPPPVDSRTVGRFLEEAQVTSQLDHPGIVPVHELGLDSQGRVFFTMKLVKGEDLKAVYARVHAGAAEWSQTRALSLLLRVCEAMSYAHSKGVIHRDLKPSNIMVGRFGEVFVMDWGLARVLGHKDEKDLRLRPPSAPLTTALHSSRRDQAVSDPDSPLVTMDGDVVGTPAYMSPEQASGRLERMGPPSDVYAMGAMLYHLLTGRMPYVSPGARPNNYAILSRVQEGPPLDAASLAPQAPPELVAICEKAMAREPGSRYADMSALADDLRAYLEHRVVAAYETGAVAELRKWVVRNRPLAAALAAGVLLLAGGLTASLVFKARSDRNAALAREHAEQAGQAAELAERRRLEAEQQRQFAQEQEGLARQKTNDVLALSTIQELKELTERAETLWPADRERVPEYERWLAEAQVLVEGSATHPGLDDHQAKLEDLRQRALPVTAEQADQQRRASPRYAEWERTQAQLTWMRRMLGDERWPDEAEVEAGLAQEPLPADANGLNALAWPLVDPDPARAVYGGEIRALILARRAVAAATEAERAGIRDTLGWALFRSGRPEQALAEEQRAVDEAQGELKPQLAASLTQMQERIAHWAPGEAREARLGEVAELSAHARELEAEVSGHRTHEFADAQDRWWHTQLSGLVTELRAFADEGTGLFSEGLSAEHGWGIAKRLAFARSVEARSVSGAEAGSRWTEAIAAIASSPHYRGLALTPQLGLLPIGPDRESGLWEFWHLQSGDEPLRGPDGKLEATDATGVVLVLIPGGSFWMGAQKTDPSAPNYDELANPSESPVHDVQLSPYFLSKYEMTQGQWERATGSNPSQYKPGVSYGDHPTTLRHPVESLNWHDAMTVLPRLGLELPTEAQWERGCRAGTDTPWTTGRTRDSLIGSVNLADQAAARAGVPWTSVKDWPELDDGWVLHAAVGSFRPNAFGLHDVHGNVWEWCRDAFDARFYEQAHALDPFRQPGADTPSRVARGGSFNPVAAIARSANRGTAAPDLRLSDMGLRPARSIAR